MKVLVLGGTNYFGRHLLHELVAKNAEVHVATRGNKEVPFKDQVHIHVADRKNLKDLMMIAELGPFDIIFDQICMSGPDARNAHLAFRNKCRRYVLTSTGSVYDFKNNHEISEEEFDYKNYPSQETVTGQYQEDKRQAEVIFGNQKDFPAAMVRFPIVLGEDDYTKRLWFHIERIKQEKEIYIPRIETNLSFIHSHEAGKFLSFIGQQNFSGAVNAASDGSVSIAGLIHEIEAVTLKKFRRAHTMTMENGSPFGSELDFVMKNTRAKSLGFEFQKLDVWLPDLIRKLDKVILS